MISYEEFDEITSYMFPGTRNIYGAKFDIKSNFKVGDYVLTIDSGIHRVEKIINRKGESSLVVYRKIIDSHGKKIMFPQEQGTRQCDKRWCVKATKKRINEIVERAVRNMKFAKHNLFATGIFK